MTRFRGLLLALVLQTLGRLWLGARLGLAPEEAYAWCWAQDLAAGYAEAPPLAAWGVALGTAALGDTELGVRAAGIVAQALAYGLLLRREPRSLLALFLLGAPLLALGGGLATPTAYLCAAWALGLAAFERKSTVLLVIALTGAMLSAWTGWLLGPALLYAGERRRVGLALGVALLLCTPTLVWNAQEGWISLHFALSGLDGAGGGLFAFLRAWVLQGVLMGPFAVLAAWAWFGGGWRDRLAWCTAALPLGLACVAAARGGAAPGDLSPVWISVALGLSRSEGLILRLGTLGGTLAAMLGLSGALHAVRPIVRLDADPLGALAGGALLAQSAEAWGRAPVLCGRWQECAWIRFYGGIGATTVPDTGRVDQFDLWPRQLPEQALFVRVAREGDALPTDRFYARRGETNLVVARDGERVVGAWQLIPVEGLIR